MKEYLLYCMIRAHYGLQLLNHKLVRCADGAHTQTEIYRYRVKRLNWFKEKSKLKQLWTMNLVPSTHPNYW